MKMLCLALLAAPLALPAPLAAQPARAQSAQAPGCSARALPPAERQRMEAEYRQRKLTDGKPSADTWLRSEATAFYQKLVDRGVCPPAPAATSSAKAGKPTPHGKDGKPCKRTRLENRNVANLSGGAMSMVLVPVCDD